LGEYVRKRSLTEEDFKALARFYLEYGLPDSPMFRTVLLRWQREKPDATLPMELMAQASQGVNAAEVEALRLGPMTDSLLKLAEKDAEPLRQYESYLMESYRAHRSVFNQPPAELLETVLERLLQTDPANQRVYKCHQGEVAWDQGDDAKCASLTDSALSPDRRTGGPVNFAIDPGAPQIVILRKIEILWRGGKLADAWTLCQDAKREGFIGSNPMLDLVFRKVEAYAAAQAPALAGMVK
jgi:hypothetical protein